MWQLQDCQDWEEVNEPERFPSLCIPQPPLHKPARVSWTMSLQDSNVVLHWWLLLGGHFLKRRLQGVALVGIKDPAVLTVVDGCGRSLEFEKCLRMNQEIDTSPAPLVCSCLFKISCRILYPHCISKTNFCISKTGVTAKASKLTLSTKSATFLEKMGV